MRITLVDTAVPGRPGSMGRYAGLVEAANVGGSVHRIRIGPPARVGAVSGARAETWVRHAWNLSVGRLKLARVRSDLFHVLDGSYAYVAAGLDPARCVVTCHDMIPWLQREGRLPGRQGPAAVRIMDRSARVLRRARHVLAVSEATRQDAIRIAGLDPGRVSVVPNALAPEWFAVASPAPAADARGDTPPVILHLGNNAPYKNRAGVVRVFARIRQVMHARLIMAGARPDPGLQRLAEENGVAGFVEWLSEVEESRLKTLYRSASLLLFPSLYEGFGWPVLEAMACGCPVVCSNAGSLPEVAGTAALMAAPEDEGGLASHCLAILREPRVREALQRGGVRHVSGFSVARMMEGVRRAYAE
jgi:glycosyltransferase involved in cell wall biosynthesis